MPDDQAHPNAELDQLVVAVLGSPRYRAICADLVRRVGARELEKRRSLKEAVKSTKKKLHQVGGAYLERKIDYGAWLAELEAASKSGEDFRSACTRMMGYHSSTRERLEILDEFYTTVLAGLPPARSVLDLACGLNPLAIPWMGLPDGAAYYACDIYEDLANFLQAFMALTPVRGRAQACDVLHIRPLPRVDLALILKGIPCLEQLDRPAVRRLLDEIEADHLLISFPVHSLCGRGKGMPATYEARFRDLVADRPWSIRRFEFATELAFLVSKQP